MKNSSSTEFTIRDGRRFGLQVGIAFLLLGGLFYWRGHLVPLYVVLTLGVPLLIGGAVIPGSLGPVYRAWMKVALAISKVTTPLFMGIVYFVVLTPTGLLMRAMGKNPVVHAPGEDGYWVRRESGHRGDMKRQF